MKHIALGILVAGAGLCCGCVEGKVDRPGPLGSLSAVRSALQIYYGDMDGKFPERLEALTDNGKYLDELPALELPDHPKGNGVLYLSGPAMDPAGLTDTGGYAYYNSKEYPATYGNVVINCTHKREKGGPWYSF